MRCLAAISGACLLTLACARPQTTGTSAQALLVAAPRAEATPGADAAPSMTAAAADGSLAWSELNAATFARARAEGRLVLIDGSAEWCHWCHVMDATTYRDPEVRKLLAERFLPVRVDIDSRPDFEERYSDWGWPATVLMTPDAEEIAKYRGYMPPAKLLEALNAAAAAPTPPVIGGVGGARATAMQGGALTEGQIAEAAALTQKALDYYYDPKQGSWGELQKVPLYWDNAWALEQARAGSEAAKKRALFTLDQQRKIIDPVWGGVCQYSTDGDWLHPHFEKLAPYQAGAIDNYATAFALTGDAQWLRTAELVRGFVDRFLTGPDGGFYVTMDADLNAHEANDAGKPFVSGRDYYAKDDAARRALGIPRVDTHEYGRDNGLMIAAYATLGHEGHDPSAIAAAERAAARILATHGTDATLGGITHAGHGDPDDLRALYLADNAAFGFGLTRLYEVTGKAEYLDDARRIADFMVHQLAAPAGGFYASTPDPAAVGVLAARRRPFEDNVMAVRFLARLARLAPTDAYRGAVRGALAAVATKDAIDERGRMVGDLMLAIDESRAAR
ncbi:MAG TPA: DUF255 domain-containing protein [Polyangiaceae bacterium]|jgi:hypothetical protein|nr:DUF255 domain-containing protein [Polyangiaceae bacterium]